jgi:beta-glucanase (GH16 family)
MFLVDNPSGNGDDFRQYRGGEVRTNDEFQYGRFDTCVRWGKGSGVVASFFTYVFGPWNEIDIEYLGGNPVGIQYNIIWDEGGGNQYDPQFDPLGLDPADAFHQYSMEWVPGEVRFYVDGQLRHTENGNSASKITRSTTLRMNLWASWTGFAGDFDPGAIPTESWYDWVRVYDYN